MDYRMLELLEQNANLLGMNISEAREANENSHSTVQLLVAILEEIKALRADLKASKEENK